MVFFSRSFADCAWQRLIKTTRFRLMWLVVVCGLFVKINQGQSVVPFLGCLSSRRSEPDSTPMMHAWDLFLKYYETKVPFIDVNSLTVVNETKVTLLEHTQSSIPSPVITLPGYF